MFNGNESNFSVGTAISFDVSLESAYGNLMGFLKSENFLPQMAAIFGESEDLNKLQALADTWISGNFSQIPPIQIVPGNLMNGANGAFSELTGRIYLSSDYLSQNSSNPDPLTGGVTGVLLEEIGHFVDTVINPGSDTPGDEGELFAATLMGLPLSNAERYRINLEDDHSFITINNQLVPVEQSVTLPVITVMATDDSAIETSTGQPANLGQFTLVRTGNTAAALTLNYILGGTATNGKDYSKLDGKVTFAPGSSTAVVNVKPIDDNLLEGKETIILTLANGTGYTIGTVKKATITIANIDPRGLADFLWDKGNTVSQIGVNLKNRGFSLRTIADALDDGVTKSDGTGLNYTDVAIGLWNSGHSLDTRILADLLWDEGATEINIAQALNYGINRSLMQIASDIRYGVTKTDGSSPNYTSVAIGLWNSGLKIDSRVLADILWDTGATQSQIAQALNYGIGRNLLQIASDMKYGVTLSDGKSYLNYTDVAIGLWNSGLKIDSRVLADILWDTGATQSQIAQALNYGIGRNLLQIASDMKYGVTLSDGKSYLNYTDVAIGLWNSGLKIDSRVLADILWDIGATQSQIAQTMKYSNPDLNYRGFNLQTIADALDDGVTKSDGTGLNYIDVAIGLWNSGYSLDTRSLADLLWDEGATVIEIAQAMKYGNQNFNYPGFDLRTIADALRYGVTKIDNTNLNYTTIARGLWNSGYSLDTRILADLLWDTGATQGEIAQALNFEIGRNLTQIANDMKYGVTLSNGKSFNYYDIALGLWESGLAVSTRDIARELQNIGANAVDTSQVLHYQLVHYQLDASLEVIADALDDGATFSYRDIADGLWNSGYKFSDYRLSRLLRYEGAGFWETVEAVDAVATTYAQAVLVTIQGEIKDIINHVDQRITPIVKKLETFYEDNKSILWVATPILVVSVEATKVIIKSIESGNVDPIVDTLKKIPVAGTAVGIIEGVINAVQGNEKDTLKSAIDSALALNGVSTVITPSMVDFAVDIFWELKDKDYQGAISETLNNLGLPKKVAEIFVSVAWAMEKGNWETAVNTALTKVGFGNTKELVDIAWDIIDKNYQGVLKTGLELVGFNTLGIDQAKANAFINITVAIRDGNFNKAADYLISLAGSNAQQISQRSWVKDLRDGNSVNDRQAIQTGLSELGFKNAIQWVDVIWAVKDGKYVDALSGVLSLGNFKNTQDWVKIIDNLQKQNYLDALSTAFRLAGFQDGQSLAEAAIAVRNGNFIEAFYESFDLIEGGSELKEAFKAIQDFNLQEFVTSMKNSAPLLLKTLV